jgi:hypothetical protein
MFFLTAVALPVMVGQQQQRRQTKAGCPPPVGQFLVMRERPRRVRKRIGEEIARIAVRENNYFGRTRCSVPEEIPDNTAKIGGNIAAGRRSLNSLLRVVEEAEEEDEEVRGVATRRRQRSCTLYLKADDFPESQLEMTVLLMTELIPGLAAYCDSPLAAQAHVTVEFCQEDDDTSDCAAQKPVLPRDDRSWN